jgi:hypothetical protein
LQFIYFLLGTVAPDITYLKYSHNTKSYLVLLTVTKAARAIIKEFKAAQGSEPILAGFRKPLKTS